MEVAIRKLEHAATQALTVAETLRTELTAIRKQTVDIELSKRSKRLAKEANQMFWSLEQIKQARETLNDSSRVLKAKKAKK